MVASLPWLMGPIVTAFRLSRSRSLADESDLPPVPAPFVSVVVPARNEAHNIGACVRALLASCYPEFEVVVVDDHSTDGTASEVGAIGDDRMRLISNPALPSGWFGKQWACQTGASAARGTILVFVDADTRVSPALLTRSVNGMLRTGAELYSVLGRQLMESFWERMIQPQIFTMLASRYGGTESVNRSRHVADKIANGQYLMMRRDTYGELGGHALVRQFVAEDLMLAQKVFAAGRKTVIVAGWSELSTRMYTSLRELVGGWGKNVYAGGRDAMPFGLLGRIIFPAVLPLPALAQLVPLGVLLLAPFAMVGSAVVLWSALATLFLLVWWMFVYWMNEQPIAYALLYPIGAAAMLYIMVTATLRGSKVIWKGRNYRSA